MTLITSSFTVTPAVLSRPQYCCCGGVGCGGGGEEWFFKEDSLAKLRLYSFLSSVHNESSRLVGRSIKGKGGFPWDSFREADSKEDAMVSWTSSDADKIVYFSPLEVSALHGWKDRLQISIVVEVVW